MKIDRKTVISDARMLKINLTDEEVNKYVDEINKFISLRPNDIDYEAIKPLRYVNENVVNVFSSSDEVLVDVEDLLKNVHDKEGNYIKVPKVLK